MQPLCVDLAIGRFADLANAQVLQLLSQNPAGALAEPRYASLPNIMKAKKKPLDRKRLGDFGIDTAARLRVLKTEEPAGRKAGVKVKSVEDLVSSLEAAGVV